MTYFNRTKRIIYIILVLTIFGVVGFILYRLLTPAVPSAPQAPTGITGRPIDGALPGGAPAGERASGIPPLPDLPSIAEQKLVRLTDFAVISPSLNKTEDKILFYKKDGGDLLVSDLGGSSQQKLSNLTIIGLTEAVWAPARDRAAVFYLDSGAVRGFLHIGTSTVSLLPADITSAVWSPDGKSFAYTRKESDDLVLVISDAAGKNPRAVFKTPVLDAHIRWISADRIAFATPPSGLAEGYAFIYSRASGIVQKVLGPVFGLESLWSPAASRVLISSTPRGGGRLNLAIYDPAERKSQGLAVASFADKCAWGSEEEIWCAAPRNLASASLLPDQYLTGEFHTSDRIVRIELKTNGVEEIFGEGDFDMENPILTKDKKYLFFVNRGDGTLWALKLE